MDKLLKYNGVQEALKFLREDDERTLQEHLEMCQIPAPSYEAGEKAEYVRKKMEMCIRDRADLESVC